MKDLFGVNALTVMVSPSLSQRKTKMFFCPYRKNIVLAYQGEVASILPGYDPDDTPQFYVRPQRQAHEDNIHYVFSKVDRIPKTVEFWVQHQYFEPKPVRTYHCFNCQSPQLYFNDKRAVTFHGAKEVYPGTEYLCDNCKISLTFMGIVGIKRAVVEL